MNFESLVLILCELAGRHGRIEWMFILPLPLKVKFSLNCINNSQISWLDSFVHPIKNNPFPSSTLIYNYTLKYGFHKNCHL